MIEKFEDRRLFGKINLACKFEDGTVRYWEARKEDVVAQIQGIVNRYQKMGFTLTLRQLHYQFVKNNWIVNHDSAYKKLGNILDDCRYGGEIDWNSIEDRGRVPHLLYAVDSVDEALSDTVDYFRRNRQEGQKIVVEVWSEKDALSAILKRVTEKYHVRLVINKGYTSSSAIYGAYRRILEHHSNEQKTIILYFGDHDPSGLDMIRDISDRLTHMLSNGKYKLEPDDCLQVIPIGLNMRQIKQFRLPPNPTKMTDSRSAGYITKHGKTCWEVDALDPDVLMELLENNIKEIVDMDQYKDMLDAEEMDIETLKSFISTKE